MNPGLSMDADPRPIVDHYIVMIPVEILWRLARALEK